MGCTTAAAARGVAIPSDPCSTHAVPLLAVLVWPSWPPPPPRHPTIHPHPPNPWGPTRTIRTLLLCEVEDALPSPVKRLPPKLRSHHRHHRLLVRGKQVVAHRRACRGWVPRPAGCGLTSCDIATQQAYAGVSSGGRVQCGAHTKGNATPGCNPGEPQTTGHVSRLSRKLPLLLLLLANHAVLLMSYSTAGATLLQPCAPAARMAVST